VAIPTFGPDEPAPHLQAALATEGVLIIENAVDTALIDAIRNELDPLLAATSLGDNPFDGFTTRRIFDPLARTRVLDQLVLHPQIQAVIASFLLWPYHFGMTFVSEVLPGEVAQRLHRDASVYPLPEDFPEVEANTVWALSDFTADNGATVVAPRSHQDREQRTVIPAVMSAGSVLVYAGRLLHGAGANRSDVPRLSLIIEHVARWLRPAECHPVSIGPSIVATLPVELQELVGFNQTNEYFGFIAGQSPNAWLARTRSDQTLDRHANTSP
jgi:ectoine hydroxylase-related dioxygenase (phytanoyl-CoA dioxygenase family)